MSRIKRLSHGMKQALLSILTVAAGGVVFIGFTFQEIGPAAIGISTFVFCLWVPVSFVEARLTDIERRGRSNNE